MRRQARVRGQCLDFFKVSFSWRGPFSESLLNVPQYCFCFMFWFFGHKACGISAPQSGMEPSPPALEGKVLNIGPPRKFLSIWTWFTISHKHTHRICFSVSSPILRLSSWHLPCLPRYSLCFVPSCLLVQSARSIIHMNEKWSRKSREDGCTPRGAGSKGAENS